MYYLFFFFFLVTLSRHLTIAERNKGITTRTNVFHCISNKYINKSLYFSLILACNLFFMVQILSPRFLPMSFDHDKLHFHIQSVQYQLYNVIHTDYYPNTSVESNIQDSEETLIKRLRTTRVHPSLCAKWFLLAALDASLFCFAEDQWEFRKAG